MATATRTPNKSVRRLESISSAAEYLGVADKTIRRMISRGDITGYRAGPRLIRVDRNELDALLRPIPCAHPSGTHATGLSHQATGGDRDAS